MPKNGLIENAQKINASLIIIEIMFFGWLVVCCPLRVSRRAFDWLLVFDTVPPVKERNDLIAQLGVLCLKL